MRNYEVKQKQKDCKFMKKNGNNQESNSIKYYFSNDESDFLRRYQEMTGKSLSYLIREKINDSIEHYIDISFAYDCPGLSGYKKFELDYKKWLILKQAQLLIDSF